MPKSASTRLIIRFALVAAAAVLMHGGSVTAAELKVCIDAASPAADVDARVAAAVADAQSATLKIHRYKGLPKGDDDDFELRNYKTLLAENCDLAIGFPLASAGDLPRFLKATRPYATTGFILVTAHGNPVTRLDAMKDGTRVAVAYNTVPNFYFPRHPNLVREIVEAEADAVDAVSANSVAAAMLWRASAVRYLESKHALAKFQIHPLDEPNSQYSLVALYRADNEEAGRRFETAIESLRKNGTLAKALGSYADVAAASDGTASLAARSSHTGLTLPRTARVGTTCAKAKSKAPPQLYTEAQATTGQQLFNVKCALCHGPLLEGRAGPALKGKFFLSDAAKHTLGDIFMIVSQNMPATQPASLPPEEYVTIMAYLLQQNGYPPGTTELTFEGAKTSKTQLRDLTNTQ